MALRVTAFASTCNNLLPLLRDITWCIKISFISLGKGLTHLGKLHGSHKIKFIIMELIPLCSLAAYCVWSSLGFLCFPCLGFQVLSWFSPLSPFPARSSFQIARNKRKAPSTVPRRQDNLHAPVTALDAQSGVVPLVSTSDPSSSTSTPLKVFVPTLLV